MPNIKSAKKRVDVTAAKKLQNQMVRSQMNTAIKKFNAAIASNNIQLAEELLPHTASRIDEAAVKHIIHKNNANHKKAQIAKTLHQLKSGVIVIKLDVKAQKQAEQKAAAVRKAQELETAKKARKEASDKKAAAEAASKPAPKKVKK